VFPIVAAVAVVASSQADAQLVTSGVGTASIANPALYDAVNPQANGTIIINFDGSVNKTTVSGLQAQLTLTFLGWSGSSYYFSYSLLNNSTIGSRVSGFAFDTSPVDAISGTAQGTFKGLTIDANYPNGVKSVDLCLSNDNGQGCSGPGGVSNIAGANPGTGTFSLLFNGSPAPTQLNLSNFHVRYQEVASTLGSSGTGNFKSFSPLPEPGTWGMLLLGFASIGAVVRRKSVQQVPQLT
jgi:hypothetical protein